MKQDRGINVARAQPGGLLVNLGLNGVSISASERLFTSMVGEGGIICADCWKAVGEAG